MANELEFTERPWPRFSGSRSTVTSRYIHSADTALTMTADAVAGYIQGLLNGVQFKRSSYASRLSPSRDEPIVRGGYEAGRACRADREHELAIIARRNQEGRSHQGAGRAGPHKPSLDFEG